MKIVKYLSIALGGLLLFVACQKEYSTESGYAGMIATGTLLDTAGSCKNVAVSGSYVTGTSLTDSNYVTIQVNFTGGGSYRIFTDTENGFSFQDSGYIGPGLHTLKLKATGTPVLAKQTDFTVAFDTTFCTFSVTVLGNTPANYTLVSGAGGICANPTISGTYTTGTALNSSNIVTLEVAVTTPGSYSVTTPAISGMVFSGTGNLTTPGLQIITLQGSGTPTTTGSFVFPVTAGSSNCNFTIPVTAGTGGDPNTSNTAWSFTEGTKSFNGPFYDAFDTSIVTNGITINGIILLGYTPVAGDTTMQLGMFTLNPAIQPGTYSTSNFGGFYFTDYRNTNKPDSIYTATPQTPAASTTITVASYNTTTHIITGTFTGTAIRGATTATANITSGKFTAKVR